MQTFEIRFSIKDGDGQHQYDYCDDFLMELNDVDCSNVEKTKNKMRENLLFKYFKDKVKQAVKDWFNEDAEAVRDDINQYGYCNYNYEPTEDDDQTEADYAVENFPARSVAHIPDHIMKNNGFQTRPEPAVDHEFYNDLGFLNN